MGDPSASLLMDNRLGDPSEVSVIRWLGDKSLACSQALPPGRVPMFADLRVHGLNEMGDPDFLYAAPDMTACAAFSKESRMRFANATKLHRKSEGGPSFFLFL